LADLQKQLRHFPPLAPGDFADERFELLLAGGQQAATLAFQVNQGWWLCRLFFSHDP
jgi:hypothetical protein